MSGHPRFTLLRRSILSVVTTICICSTPAAQESISPADTIRAQVNEGMILSAAAKAAIVATYVVQGAIATDRTSAGMTAEASDTGGKYVASIDISQAEIIIVYGNEADAAIAGKVLVITPFMKNGSGEVFWQCGLSTYGASSGAIALGSNTSNSATTVGPQYLHAACLE